MPWLVRKGTYYRSEGCCEDVAKFQVRNKEGYLRWFPRWLRKGWADCCSGPIFVVALCGKLKVEANIEMML